MHRAVEERECPLTVVQQIGLQVVRRFRSEAGFGQLLINRDNWGEAAPFFSMLTVPFVGEKAFKRDQQERAKLSFLLCGGSQIILFEQSREKTLREVFGISRAVAGAARVSVERIPISAAKSFKRGGRLSRGFVPGGEDDRPVSGDERGARRGRFR